MIVDTLHVTLPTATRVTHIRVGRVDDDQFVHGLRVARRHLVGDQAAPVVCH